MICGIERERKFSITERPESRQEGTGKWFLLHGGGGQVCILMLEFAIQGQATFFTVVG